MKKNIFTLLACLIVCCFGFAQNNIIDNELQKILNQKGNDYIDVNIMLKAQMTSDDFAVLNCESDSKEVRRELVTNELKKFAENSQKDIMSVLQAEERSNKVTDIKNFWIANFINCKAKADVIYQLASHPDVATISYNSVMEVVSDTEETNSSDTRAITATIGDHLKQIKADEAWKLGYTGKDVVVAVLDSGVNTDHTDLKDHLWNGNAQHGYNVVNPGSAPVDDRSHGTHCAGIVCGDGTSGSLTGVAPDATLMSIKLYDSNAGLTVDRLLAGVQFAADKEADILSISQGWLGASDANRNTLRTTFENLLQQGIIAVVAAGNDRIDIATYPVPGNIRTPGDCPPPWLHPDQTPGGKSSVVSVGAVDDKNEIVGISSQGPVTWEGTSYNDYPYNEGASMGLIRPDIVAPATILSLSNASNTQYVIKGGTSQAAPCVAGVMALMLEKNRDLTPEDLCRIVETTATQKTAKKDNLYGSGVVDALKAVRYVDFHVDTSVIRPYAFSSTLNAYENINFELTLINNGEAATNGTTTVTISESDDYTTIVEDTKTYAQMAVDATASASFVVSFDHLIPDNHEVTFTINAGGHIFDLVVTVSNELVPPTLTATANGTDINLSWNETNNATSYNIYRDGVLLTNTPSTSYTDTGLEYGTIYAYNITTKRNDLESEHSLTARAQTEDNPNRPSPTNVVATDNGTYVKVTWTNGEKSNASNIYRKDINTGTETSIATNVNGASYNDNNWDSVEDGIYQYGVANTYAANENLYTEGFENTTVTLVENEYTNSNSIWYSYYVWSNQNDYWRFKENSNLGGVTFTPCDGSKSAFFSSSTKGDEKLSYLVSPKFNLTEHNGNTIKLSFYYINPAWGGDINTLKVMVSTSYNSDWKELWSSGKKDVPDWTDAVVDLSAYTGQQIYIAFVNIAGAGYCTGVDNVNISIEGSSESRIEWSDNVYKNVNIFVQDGLWSNIDNWSAKRLPNETEKVIIDANATITSDSDITVYSLLINEGKSLTLNSDVKLRVTDDFVNNDADAFIINDGAQVFQSNDDVAATFLMNIVSPRDTEGYSSEEEFNPTGWQFIASPMKDAKINDFVPTFNYDLFKYDGTQELEWLNHKYEPIELTAPQNLMAEATSTSTIRLSWSPVDGATSYNVYYDGNDVPFATTADNTFEITGLTPGKQYCYTVTSATADNESEKPSAVCTKTITLAPQLVANMANHSSIVLSWNAVEGAELYHVYKGNEKIASVTSLAHTVTGLDPATTYCFTVTSVGSEFLGIESAKSNEECATTDVTIPSAPQNVVLVATSPYSVKLTWDPVAGADSYNIYFIAGGEAAIDVKATEYIFEGLTPGMGYCYNVTAVNKKGESQPSGSNSVNTPLPTPEAPQLAATPVGSAVELTWNAPTYAATYKVYDEEGLVAESISSTTYTVYDLEAGEHCFTVIAVNAEGSESGASNTACATVTEQEQGPIAENVIIGDGNSTSIALPIYSNCAYSISQQIYTRAEIGQTGSIKAVSFKYKSGVTSSCTRTVKVYLQRTTKAFFTSGTDWVSMTNADLVYDGNITINNTPDEWVRINLDKKFEYTGDNLVVCVYDYTGKADSEITFAADQINELKGMSYYSTMFPNPLDPSNVNKTGFYNPIKRNQILFSFDTGAPEPPQNLVARSTDATTIHLSWDPSDGATSYEIYLGNMGGDPIGYTSDTEYDVTGLEKGYTYCYAVKAVNDKGVSGYSELECATAGDIQFEMCNLIFTLRDSWGDGWIPGTKLIVSYGTGSIEFKMPYTTSTQVKYYETIETLEIQKGTEVTVTFVGTENLNEISFDVKCENGTVLASAAKGSLTGVDDVFTFIADCTPKVPNAPVLTANATSSSTIALSWNEVATATSYNVYQGGNKITTVTTPSYNVEGLTANTEYCFTVKAVNNIGESAESTEECVMTEEEASLCDVIFTLRDSGNDGWNGNYLVVSYSDISETLELTSGSIATDTLAIPQGANVTVTYTKGTSLYTYPTENSFTITYESGKEIFSVDKGILIATTSYDPFTVDCTPTAPEELVVSASVNGESAITLTMSALGADSYTIYQGGNLVEENITETTYTVEGLTADTEYCFTVVAVNEVGSSESVEVCARTKAAGLQSVTVQIGEGTNYTYSTPIYNYYSSKSISQTIYTTKEIGTGAGTITSISFNKYNGNNNTRNISVYLKNTNKDCFTSTTDWEVLSEDLCVYNGGFEFGTNGWVTIELQNSFSYEGGNLLVCIIDNTGSSLWSGMDYFYVYDIGQATTDARAIFANGSNIKQDLQEITTNTGTFLKSGSNYRAPQIKLSLEISASKSSSAPAKMTDIKGGFDKADGVSSSGTELSRFETTFQQGVGYLASYEIETTATFKGTLNHEDFYVFELDDYDNNKNVGNFNLLGNPFSFNMDWNKVTSTNLVKGYAVVNKDGGYEYFTDGEIKVGDGFLVKVSGEGPALSYNTRSRKTENESNFLNIVSSGKAGNDNVIIKLDGEQDNFPKLENFNDDIALVYVTDNDIAYGIYNCNSEVQEVSLVFKASRMGEYNLHIEPNGNFDHVTLVDLYNGAETNMLTSSYSFTAIPKENGKRFVLKFAKGEGAAEDKFAFLSGNELIVEAEGTVQIIDVMGRVVYSNDVTSDNNRIDTSKFNTAAYIIRLINDNGVKTQKIVVY